MHDFSIIFRGTPTIITMKRLGLMALQSAGESYMLHAVRVGL